MAKKDIGEMLFKALMQKVFEEDAEEEVVGKLSPELLAEHKKMHRDHRDLEQEVEAQHARLMARLKDELEDMYSERINAEAERHLELWKRTAEYLNVSPEDSLTVDRATGEVSRKGSRAPSKDSPKQAKVFDFTKGGNIPH